MEFNHTDSRMPLNNMAANNSTPLSNMVANNTSMPRSNMVANNTSLPLSNMVANNSTPNSTHRIPNRTLHILNSSTDNKYNLFMGSKASTSAPLLHTPMCK